MRHKTKFREHFLPIRVFLNSLNNDIVESNSSGGSSEEATEAVPPQIKLNKKKIKNTILN
jgi:hypothetical protein